MIYLLVLFNTISIITFSYQKIFFIFFIFIIGFAVDFKTDNNALKSILTEEGIPFFNTPAKRSSQFGPLRKRSSERVAPFSRLSNAKKPISRTTLGVSRASNLGLSQVFFFTSLNFC